MFFSENKKAIKYWHLRIGIGFTLAVLLATMLPTYAFSSKSYLRIRRRPTTTTTKVATSTTTIKVPQTLATTTSTQVSTSSSTTSTTTSSVTTQGNSLNVQPFGQANDGNWNHIIFQDNFDSTTALWQRNWRMGDDIRISPPANKSYEAACWDPKNTTTANGNLVMKAEARSCIDAFGTSYNYASGGASSGKFNFTFGYAEAKILMPADANNKIANFPAFWLNGVSNDNGGWPAGGEIDIVEGLSDHVSNWHYHWGTSSNPLSTGGIAATSLVPTMSNPSGWHTYGVNWSATSIKYYYDGILVSTITTGVVSTPMYIALDNAVPAKWSPTLPANMLVDYVRVWQR